MSEKKEKRPLYDYDRKGIKKAAHANVRQHYLMLLFVCLLLVFVGIEFSSARSIFDTSDPNQESAGSVQSGPLYKGKTTEVFEDLLSGQLEKGDKKAKAQIEKYKKKADNGKILGRSRGVFATGVNSITSGYLLFQIAQGIKSLSHSEGATLLIFGILLVIVYLGIWLFIKVPISAVTRRVFLEARTYKKVPMHELVWIQSVHRWPRVCLALALQSFLGTLWWLTIVGGMIKHYSYSMVPYIVAENPDIKPKEAILLSRKIMYGHKWQAFVLDLTLLPWDLLAFVTLGVSDLLYGVPYRVGVKTEYYTYIRKCAKADGIPEAARLNDIYLYEHADEETLWKKYMDINSTEEYIEANQVEVKPWQEFFIKNFGLWIGNSEQKNDYQKVKSMEFQIRKEKEAIAGNIYPRRLNLLYDEKTKDLEGTVSAFRCYTVWSIIIMFFAISFVGWVWEVSLHIITDGVFVNRGTMFGPWLPIYGFGAMYILLFLNRLRKNVVAEFIGAIVLSGIVEYMTSWYLEVTKGMRWWDYTGYFLNLNGRICGEGLLIFGLGGLAAVYLVAPLLDEQISKLKSKQVISVCVILLALYNIDGIYSHYHPNVGKGITDYSAYQEEQ